MSASECIQLLRHHHQQQQQQQQQHQSLNLEGRWGTTDDFATSFLHFHLFSTALWNLANSRPDHSLIRLPTSSSVCLVFLLLSLCLTRWFWPDLINRRHDQTTAVCVSLRWSGGLRWILARTSSLEHGLCKKCVVSCGSTSFPWLVFFFGALL